MTDLREAHAKGYIGKLACHNSVLGVFETEDMTPVLRSLVERSAEPLKVLESTFACDSSGFSGCRFDRWFDHKFGDRRIQRAWCKAHIMTGCKTNVITAVEIHEPYASDGVQLKPLLATTAQRFDVKELVADVAYSTKSNLRAITDLGADALIPFKRNATPAAGGLWEKLYYYFQFNKEEFLRRYHQRSNVESTFSAVKRKFGDSVRSKTDTAMRNETLAKFVCHNITRVIHEIYESGIDPACWAESAPAQQVSVL
jgi:hypothetical protein